MQHDKKALLFSLDLGNLDVKSSLSVLKNPEKPSHKEPELALLEQKSEQVLKILVFFTGRKNPKMWSNRGRVGEHLRLISGTRGFYSLGF